MTPLDREILLSYTLKKPREYLFTYPEYKPTKSQIARYRLYVIRRLHGEPIAYITGKKEFFGLDFFVNKKVLIPRPETELLVELVLKKILISQFSTLNSHIIDVGTGSGNIIISIAKNTPEKIRRKINFYALDISKKALSIAKKNAKKHKIAKNIKFIQSDLLKYFLEKKIKFENMLIVANLPYVPQKLYQKNSKNLKYEPKIALISKKNGLDYYLKLLSQIKQLWNRYYASHVTCYFEISPEQKKALIKAVKKELPSAKIKFFKDLAGKTRSVKITIEN